METRKPSILVPYPGPVRDGSFQDIFVYLRPETNGVKVESVMLKAIQKNPAYKNRLFLTYLANIPGDFIAENRVIEDHYALRLFFAVHGRKVFTPFMRASFQAFFRSGFDEANIIGAFEAMREFNLDPDQLFKLWVPADNFCLIHGQSIKKYDNHFIVNYDLPSLVQKNKRDTDVAAMIFRTSLSYEEFTRIVRDMEKALLEAGLIKEGTPLSYVFHYSKGPFEQVLDAIGYLYDQSGAHLPVEQISFAAFLAERGIDTGCLKGCLYHPILVRDNGQEEYLYSLTRNDSFEDACDKLLSVVGSACLPRHFA
jgi:hypothetical protein